MVLYNNDSNDDNMLMMVMVMNYRRLHGTPRANVDDGNTIIASDMRRSLVFLSPLLLLLLLLLLMDHIDTFKETDMLLRSRRSISSSVVSSNTEQSVCTFP